MMKFDHLSIPVISSLRSRDWYVATLGLNVEFEVPDQRMIALQDSEGFAIFLQEVPSPVAPDGCALWFQVADVDATLPNGLHEVSYLHMDRENLTGVMGSNWRTPTAIPSDSGMNAP